LQALRAYAIDDGQNLFLRHGCNLMILDNLQVIAQALKLSQLSDDLYRAYAQQRFHTLIVSLTREPRKIKNLTPTEAYKKTPCGAKGSNKLYIKMTELTQAASY
jgi:hypothetical protein